MTEEKDFLTEENVRAFLGNIQYQPFEVLRKYSIHAMYNPVFGLRVGERKNTPGFSDVIAKSNSSSSGIILQFE